MALRWIIAAIVTTGLAAASAAPPTHRAPACAAHARTAPAKRCRPAKPRPEPRKPEPPPEAVAYSAWPVLPCHRVAMRMVC